MAQFFPQLTKQTLDSMNEGEKRLAQRLAASLEDDCLVWHDIPISKGRYYPDFIILHPSRGLLLLEVKDWKLSTLEKIDKSNVSLWIDNSPTTRKHPLEQARQYIHEVVNRLSRDSTLCQTTGAYKGKLIVPYGRGAVFTKISRKQIKTVIPDDQCENVLPDHLVIYKDEMTGSADAKRFQERLWGMFDYQFGESLTPDQINRIRWYLYPEVRINDASRGDLFDTDEEDPPDRIETMDLQQEQLARSFGEGHRVIHGVAGSGKTLILGCRCLYLTQAMNKPILVLCFNITLSQVKDRYLRHGVR